MPSMVPCKHNHPPLRRETRSKNPGHQIQISWSDFLINVYVIIYVQFFLILLYVQIGSRCQISSGATGTKSSKKAPSLTRCAPSQPLLAIYKMPSNAQRPTDLQVNFKMPNCLGTLSSFEELTAWVPEPKLRAAAVANSAGSTPCAVENLLWTLYPYAVSILKDATAIKGRRGKVEYYIYIQYISWSIINTQMACLGGIFSLLVRAWMTICSKVRT